jgi:hypothetical protein
VILPLANTSLETVARSTDPEFMALFAQHPARAQLEGGLCSGEMRHRVFDTP